MELPPFDSLAEHYPADDDPKVVRHRIGGNVDQDFLVNTCVIRVSAAMNGVGGAYAIPKHFDGLKTFRGGDGLQYAVSVREFTRFMHATYGKPDLAYSGAQCLPANFQARGVMVWHVEGWSDANGHFSLWDGQNSLHGDYFSLPREPEGKPWLTDVELWRCLT